MALRAQRQSARPRKRPRPQRAPARSSTAAGTAKLSKQFGPAAICSRGGGTPDLTSKADTQYMARMQNAAARLSQHAYGNGWQVPEWRAAAEHRVAPPRLGHYPRRPNSGETHGITSTEVISCISHHDAVSVLAHSSAKIATMRTIRRRY